MGCGCGKKKVQRNSTAVATTRTLPASASRVQVAQTYQSATMKSAPIAPVTTRKTV